MGKNKLDENIVDLLYEYASRNEYGKLVSTYEAWSNGNSGKKDRLRLYMLYGFGLYMVGRVLEARNIFEECKLHPVNTLELNFLLNYVYQTLGEYEKAIEAGKEYLKILENSSDFSGSFFIDDVESKACEICNNIGTSCTKIGKFDEAIEFFNKGLKFNDKYHLLYENLGILLFQKGDYREAENVLLKGKERVPTSYEISRILGLLYKSVNYFKYSEEELLNAIKLGSVDALFDISVLYSKLFKFKKAKSFIKEYLLHHPENKEGKDLLKSINSSPYIKRKEPEISVCMIVKNEEEMLPRCLDSVIDIADELIIVDTGSTDKTVEIAKSYGAKVYHHPWKNSFSEARNHTHEHATKDWIFSIDADEELEREDIPKIMMAKWQKDYDAICVAIYSSLPGQLGGVSRGKHYYPRFYRRRKDIYYYGIVHNLLKMPENSAMSDIRIYHYGYDLDQKRMWEKFKRSLSLLLKQVDENPDDPFVRFNIAQMYLSRNFSNEAEEHIHRALKILSPENEEQQHLYLMSLYQLALVHFRRGEWDKGKECCYKALKVKSDYIDPLLALGWLYLHKNEYKKSIEVMRKFLKCRESHLKENKYSFLILNKIGSDYEAYYVMGECFRREGNLKKANEFLEKSEKSNPYFWLIYKSKGDIAKEENNYKKAIEEYEKGIKFGYLNAERYGTLSVVKNLYSELLAGYKEVLERVIMEGKKI
ncbi:hypothetical protein DRQ09_03190 [candidate division KSB1 bacterium]|nr:MAG: hypothetical protein DRQ09_03190 [candidate division KSB1 bacterium]